MIKNSELKVRLIKSELTQMDLANADYIDAKLFNELFNVIISDRLRLAKEIYELINYNIEELDELLEYLADKKAIRAITEQFGYNDIRTVDYIADCIRIDLKDYFN